MATREEVLKDLRDFDNELEISSESYVIGAGAALVLLGLRETCDDIDIATGEDLFNFINDQGYGFGIVDGVSILPYGMSYAIVSVHLDPDMLRSAAMMVEGYWVHTPELLLIQKKKLVKKEGRDECKRSQDLKDIEALEKYIKLVLSLR